MKTAFLFVLLASMSDVSAQPNAATEDASSQAPTQANGEQAAPKEEKKICKRTMASESRMGSKRLCLTAAEWKRMQDD